MTISILLVRRWSVGRADWLCALLLTMPFAPTGCTALELLDDSLQTQHGLGSVSLFRPLIWAGVLVFFCAAVIPYSTWDTVGEEQKEGTGAKLLLIPLPRSTLVHSLLYSGIRAFLWPCLMYQLLLWFPFFVWYPAPRQWFRALPLLLYLSHAPILIVLISAAGSICWLKDGRHILDLVRSVFLTSLICVFFASINALTLYVIECEVSHPVFLVLIACNSAMGLEFLRQSCLRAESRLETMLSGR